MKLSIVLSTYNGEAYIIEQLESIRNQVKQPDEVLIFDDCSTDNTVQIVSNYITQNKLDMWEIKVNERNKGWKKNFMDGLLSATGDLIFPCDQDDIWMPDKLRIMGKLMKDNPQIQVLTSNYEVFYDSGKTSNGPEEEDGKLIKQPVVQQVFNTKFPGCTYCIRKSFVNLSKEYWELDFPHDALFWRLGMFSDSLYSYHKKLIKWRKHENSTYAVESVQFKTKFKKREWLDYALRVIKSLQEFISKYVSSDKQKKEEILGITGEWLQQRIEFYDTGSIAKWIKLLKYYRCYDRFRQYIGDFYLVKIKK